MDGGNEQRVAIKFCFKPDLYATVKEAVKRWNVFRWCSRFRDVRELVEDDESGGRPKPNRTAVKLLLLLICLKMAVESHKE
jgi:hypothetical protein